MSLPPAYGADIPVVCTRSGLVVVLNSVLPLVGPRTCAHREEPQGDLEMILHRLDVDGVSARFHGKPCFGCLQSLSGPVAGPCEYRPLAGPLFVLRVTSP